MSFLIPDVCLCLYLINIMRAMTHRRGRIPSTRNTELGTEDVGAGAGVLCVVLRGIVRTTFGSCFPFWLVVNNFSMY